MNYHSTVIDYLDLAMKIYGDILGSVDTIICGLDLHWQYFPHVLPLKLYIGHDGLLSC